MSGRCAEKREPARRASLLIAVTLVVLPLAPALAAHPIAAPTTYHVRPGSVVLACGGFAGSCHVWQLRGALEVFDGHTGHLDVTLPPAIVSSQLELVTESGHASPFPAAGDLRLEELEGSSNGGQLRFESKPGGHQTAELVLVPFRDGLDVTGGYVLDGFYDEGCCDRFRIDFGNVVLRPRRVEGALDFHRGRFRATATWRTAAGKAGSAHPVAIDDESGYFWFFTPGNTEVFVKILDACAKNGRFWIFAGGLTNLGVEITLRDEHLGIAMPIVNPVGRRFETFVDTVSFPCAQP
jgi:hypothetical protein